MVLKMPAITPTTMPAGCGERNTRMDSATPRAATVSKKTNTRTKTSLPLKPFITKPVTGKTKTDRTAPMTGILSWCGRFFVPLSPDWGRAVRETSVACGGTGGAATSVGTDAAGNACAPAYPPTFAPQAGQKLTPSDNADPHDEQKAAIYFIPCR